MIKEIQITFETKREKLVKALGIKIIRLESKYRLYANVKKI